MKKKIGEIDIENENVRLKSQLVRALADYDNLSKRTEKEKSESGLVWQIRLISDLLPVFDMIYDAQSHLEDQGLAITIQTLENTLKDDGFEKVDPKPGDVFDENLHEAVEVEKKDNFQDGEIVEVVLRGWKMTSGFTVRPAKVKVNKLN